jgi:hypothetical protein
MSERELKIKEPEAENQQLQAVVVALGAALLRDVAVDSVARQPFERVAAERLLHEAEQRFRCVGIPELKSTIAEDLEVAGRALLAKAVEIEASLRRDKKTN